MRLITDIFAYCAENVPKWNTISISGYHIREAGSTAVQEVAFTIADGIAYVEAALQASFSTLTVLLHSYRFSSTDTITFSKRLPNSVQPGECGLA